MESGVVGKKVLSETTASYWRNDDLDQPHLDAYGFGARKIVISGTGDGSMVDLIRSLLKNFHQGRLIDLILDSCKDRKTFDFHMNRIIKNYEDGLGKTSDWLYNQFSSIPDHVLRPMKQYLNSQLRRDTVVSLLGRASSINAIFSEKKMSIFNGLMVYLLHTIGSFTY